MQFSRIKERVRLNLGWSDASDLSNERLEEAVNYIYTRRIPNILNWEGLQAWAYIDLANGDSGDYPFSTRLLDASGGTAYGDRVRSLTAPFVLIITPTSSVFLDVYFKPYEFWEKFVPVTTETAAQPTHVLVDKKTVHVRPVPDGTYIVKVLANLRPAALTLAADEPTEDWAEGLIRGATAVLLEDDEESAAAPFWWQAFTDWANAELGSEALLKESQEET